MNYLLYFAGYRIGIKCPFEIIIQKESLDFMKMQHFNTSDVDICMDFIESDSPNELDIPPKGKWENTFFFPETCEQQVMYYGLKINTRAYAKVVYGKKYETICCIFDREQINNLHFSKNICELLNFESILREHEGIYLHASHVRYQDYGILFTGPSGMGKSTQAELWCRYAGAELINGDKTALRKTETGWKAYGLPFAGSSNIFRNENSKVRAIICLRRGRENVIQRMPFRQAFQYIYEQTAVHNWNYDDTRKTTDIILNMINEIPVYELYCRVDKEAVDVVMSELFQEKE